jgi:ATP adenylyltransferase
MIETFDIKSAATAISRKTLSLPAKWLANNNLLTGSVLDYGCGKGVDANILNADKYDPHYFPKPITKKYNTIYCIYVLNVLKPENVIPVILDIKSHLEKDGVAYLAVRRDIDKEGVTSKGTQQHNVILSFPVVCEKKGKFCIYKIY